MRGNRDHGQSVSKRLTPRKVLLLVGMAFLGGGALLGASPARAGGEFERGFKNELGRIAAHEAVTLGTQILGEFVYPIRVIHRPYRYAGRHGHRHHRHHLHHRRHRHFYRGGDPYVSSHGYVRRHVYYEQIEPCDTNGYERYERYEQRDHGGYEYYERRERETVPRHRVRYYRD